MHLECNKGAKCVCKLPNKFIHPYQGKNIDKCIIERVISRNMAVFNRISYVHISMKYASISTWIRLRVGKLMHTHVSYVLLNSHVNISNTFFKF